MATNSVEGCTACDWRGDIADLLDDDNDVCPGCGRRGYMTTFYGPNELREWEVADGE